MSSPIATSSTSDDNNSFSFEVIVAVVVLVLAIVIIITVVVAVIIMVWKRKKTEEHTKPEAVYYSTINETSLPRSPTSKPEPIYSETNDGQDNKDAQNMDVTPSTKQANKVTIQDNPEYSVAFDHQVKLQNNPAYHTPSGQLVEIQDNPAYSISSGQGTKQ